MFMKAMDGEKQLIMTGEIEGVPVKIKIDSYREHKTIVDLKVVKDFAPIYVNGKGKLNFIEAWGYDIQGAIYREIVRQNTGETLPFVIAAATKEKEPDIELINVDSAALDVALDIVKDNIKHFDDVKKAKVQPARCEHCDYCNKLEAKSKDLAEVVRCKDCYYYDWYEDYCNMFDFDPPSDDFYCRDGEIKGGEN